MICSIRKGVELFTKAIILILTLPVICSASMVRMETALGNIDIELFDTATPLTVANFLNYAYSGRYSNSFIHRSVPGFIVQGGGFTWEDGASGYGNVLEDPPVLNEPGHSNIRGTIAMAKLGGDPDSATSEWFFNLADNSANLDFQNGGFTVFGQVIGNGMDIVDAIAALDRINAGGAFTDLPLINYSSGDIINENNLVMINNISAVPVPAAVWLFGSGLLGLIGLASRKKA